LAAIYIARELLPSKELLETARIMNAEFTRYHGSKLSKDSFIFQTLFEKVFKLISPVDIPLEVIICLVRTRTYIRLRKINWSNAIKNRKRNKQKNC